MLNLLHIYRIVNMWHTPAWMARKSWLYQLYFTFNMNLEQNLLHIYYHVNPIFRPVVLGRTSPPPPFQETQKQVCVLQTCIVIDCTRNNLRTQRFPAHIKQFEMCFASMHCDTHFT